MQHRRSESGDGSPSPGEETAVRPKRRRNKEKKPISPEVLVNYSYKGREGTVRLSMMSKMKAAIDAEEQNKWLKEKRKMEKRQRKKEKQRLSVQHDALVVEESPMVSEHQQQSMTSSLSPDSSPTTGCFADLQGAGEATEASSAPPSGKVESKQERKISSSDSTEKSNVGGVPGIVQEAVRTHASPPREEESIKQNDDAILKKGCLNDAELLMDQSTQDASHSSSRSGDAQNEDKDVHSDKKLPFVVEDEQDSDRIGVRAIEYHKQEQGREVRHVQDLFDLDSHTIKDMIYRCLRQKHVPPKDPFDWSEYEPQQLTELYQRLALYRIRGYDYEFSVDRKLAELDDATLAHHYPPTILYDEGYFEHYEESLEWYFDPERCKYAGFEDYQRLVLRKIGYRNWDRYNSFLHTYEKDQAYVQYCEAIEDETKWIDDYLLDCSIPWERVEDVAHLQSLKIAQRFPNVSPISVSTAFREHIWSVLFDFENYKGLDDVYFEIWKRVAKRKMDFTDALSEVYRKKKEKMFPFHRVNIESELKTPQGPWSMKDNYDAYVACIDDLIPDDKALPLIKEAVKKMSPKSKNYVDYARKKMQIAKEIRLITKGRSTENRGLKGGLGAAVEPTVCNRKVPGSSPSLCTFVRVRFGRYYNSSPDPARCGKPTALGTPISTEDARQCQGDNEKQSLRWTRKSDR